MRLILVDEAISWCVDLIHSLRNVERNLFGLIRYNEMELKCLAYLPAYQDDFSTQKNCGVSSLADCFHRYPPAPAASCGSIF